MTFWAWIQMGVTEPQTQPHCLQLHLKAKRSRVLSPLLLSG